VCVCVGAGKTSRPYISFTIIDTIIHHIHTKYAYIIHYTCRSGSVGGGLPGALADAPLALRDPSRHARAGSAVVTVCDSGVGLSLEQVLTLYSILYIIYSILYTLYSILYTLYSILYTLYSILYILTLTLTPI
jgi:hypothetical protein